jgi:hypothetical protein
MVFGTNSNCGLNSIQRLVPNSNFCLVLIPIWFLFDKFKIGSLNIQSSIKELKSKLAKNCNFTTFFLFLFIFKQTLLQGTKLLTIYLFILFIYKRNKLWGCQLFTTKYNKTKMGKGKLYQIQCDYKINRLFFFCVSQCNSFAKCHAFTCYKYIKKLAIH